MKRLRNIKDTPKPHVLRFHNPLLESMINTPTERMAYITYFFPVRRKQQQVASTDSASVSIKDNTWQSAIFLNQRYLVKLRTATTYIVVLIFTHTENATVYMRLESLAIRSSTQFIGTCNRQIQCIDARIVVLNSVSPAKDRYVDMTLK